MPRRSLLTAALAAAALAAPTPTRAQSLAGFDRWYQATGCDYALAAAFGPGPRLCATATVGISDQAHTAVITHADIFADTWYRAGSTFDDPGVTFSPGAYGVDGGLNQCRIFACLGAVTEGLVEDAYITPGYVPQYLTMNVRYYETPPTSILVDDGQASAFRLAVVATPEPATVALLAGGLATLAGVGAARRRRGPAAR